MPDKQKSPKKPKRAYKASKYAGRGRRIHRTVPNPDGVLWRMGNEPPVYMIGALPCWFSPSSEKELCRA